MPQGNVELKPTVDRTSVLKNPMTGWVMYVSGSSDPSYFDTEFYVPSLGKNVLVRDYASCFYVRTGWKTFNPEEGKYFWQDPDNALYKLYKRAQELGLPMAFRVVVDGRDQRENTPQWVFDKGAQYWLSDKNYPDRKTPLAIDETWRKCYEKFIEDFAAEFNDPDKLAFIDAYGLGKWGEGHNVCYEQNNAETAMTETYKEDTMRWITGLYSRCFTKVPLVCQSCLFDLTVGDAHVRPDAAMAYAACRNAEQGNYRDGNFGAGTGATVGKIRGMERCMKSGIGSYAVQLGALKVGMQLSNLYLSCIPLNRENFFRLGESLGWGERLLEQFDRYNQKLNARNPITYELNAALEQVRENYHTSHLITAEECAQQMQERAEIYLKE